MHKEFGRWSGDVAVNAAGLEPNQSLDRIGILSSIDDGPLETEDLEEVTIQYEIGFIPCLE